MNYRNILTILFVLASAVFAPAALKAQNYQEMDAELAAAEKKFWDTKLKPAYEKALQEFNAGNYEKTIEEANKFLAYTPDAIGGLPVLRARAYAALKSDGMNFHNARADLIRAINNYPKDVWNQIHLGELFLSVNRGFEADRQFTKALAIDPNSFRALNGKAQAAYFARDFQGCVNAVTKLMAHAEYQKQTDAQAYLRLGECYASLGDKTNAKQNFERAVAVQPGLKNSWFYLAFLKDGYSCKKLGRNAPDKPFEKFTAQLRDSLCPDSLPVLFDFDLRNDVNLRDYVLFYEAEFHRRINKGEISDTLNSKDEETFLREARRLADKAKRSGKEPDEKSFNEILVLLNNAINIKFRNDDPLVEDVDVAARFMRAKLLLSHPDKEIRFLAWRDQIALSNIPKSDLQPGNPNSEFSRKPLFKNGADVRAPLLRGLVYTAVKENYRAALAEFDAAIKTLETIYVRTRFDTDAPVFAEPYWRKGDALARLGINIEAAAAYVQAQKVNPLNVEAKDGLRRLAEAEQNAGKTTNAAMLRDLEIKSRIGEIAARVNEADRNFAFTTSGLRDKMDAPKVCNAIRVFLGSLHTERGNLSRLGSSIKPGGALWKDYEKALNDLDTKIKNLERDSNPCSKIK